MPDYDGGEIMAGMGIARDYPQETSAKLAYREPLRQRLQRQKAEMLIRITQIEKTLGLLDKNPDTEEIINLLGRI